ncbi:xaa-Pro aminopeptidase 1-like isoform X1 [Dendronephthya gigantea]|uniref:xaa-Pro aminopeptidase 1-like isoform X1 n=1 Tax=Dendronephthya gigantea TaxID=151771 RepID=UPI00106BD40E|nr:xaa-Pro aminopeptidase 1-like isoform X1 [Dendronephthya gigantea]
MAKPTGELLAKLRSAMKNKAYVPDLLQAYIIPSEDAHQSEYIASSDCRRQFISGFTGSAGTAIVTQSKAALWTDGRYFLQAEQQLDSNWTLMKAGQTDTPSQADWLAQELPSGSLVGADPWLMSFDSWEKIRKTLKLSGVSLVKSRENLVDVVWREFGKPEPPMNEVFIHDMKYAGQKWQDKVSVVRSKLKEKKASAVVFTALDDVAWLFNLRGSDIVYNPVFMAYAIVTDKSVCLFIDELKLSKNIYEHLSVADEVDECHSNENKVTLRPYEDISNAVDELVSSCPGKIWISGSSSAALNTLIPKTRRLSEMSPVTKLKAVKNDVEIEGMRNAHIRDATALCEYFCWLEKEVPTGTLTEISAANKLEELRSKLDDFVSLSFSTISASGPHGAIIHYRPAESTDRRLTCEEIYLCDSGAQYRDGTTDVTRTFHFGTPNDFQKKCFTRVVKGHIALAKAVFPNKTKGSKLDSYARYSLWEGGLDYRHGTGHGVGAFLNVHEGPQGIGARTNDEPLESGMFVSDEPGFYQEGSFGFRIESILLLKPVTLENNFSDIGYIGFEPVTLFPIQTKMLVPAMLSPEEINWLNDYHEMCREKVGEMLREHGKMVAYRWLMKETEPLG